MTDLNEMLSRVWGQIEEDEAAALYALPRLMPPGPIVEVGSLQGRSACCLLLGAIAAGIRPTLYAIDTWRREIGRGNGWSYASGPGADNLQAFERNVGALEYRGEVIAVESASSEIAKVWERPIGLLHIDGDHSWDGIDCDYRGFAPFVVPGGLLAVHDYREGYDVLRYCDEVVLKDPTWEQVKITNTLLTARRKG